MRWRIPLGRPAPDRRGRAAGRSPRGRRPARCARWSPAPACALRLRAIRPAGASPLARDAVPVSRSMVGSPSAGPCRSGPPPPRRRERARLSGAVAGPGPSFHAVSAGRINVATCPGGVHAAAMAAAPSAATVLGARRGPHPGGDGPRDALDVRRERRVVLDVIGRVLAHDIDDARAAPSRALWRLARPLPRPGPRCKQRGGGPLGHAPVAVRGPRHDALEEAEDAADAVDLVEGGHEVHLRGAGVGEAHVDPTGHQRPRQTLRTVHLRVSRQGLS